MKRFYLAVCFFCVVVSSPLLLAEEHNELSLDALLKKVASGSYKESVAQQEREKRFLVEKNQQSSLLESMRRERIKLEQESERLEKLFDENERAIAEADKELKQGLGNLAEIFGHINSAATDFKTSVESSVTSVHYPQRLAFLNSIIAMTSGGSNLPSIEQINQLMFEIQREMTEQGRVLKFSSAVTLLNGETTLKPLLRIGIFNIVDEYGNYLHYADGKLYELSRQPQAHYVRLAQELYAASQGLHMVGIDPTGPAGGTLFTALINAPSLLEQWHQGGEVGYVISFLGCLALIIAVWRLLVLVSIDKKVQQQLSAKNYAADNPLGRVLLAAEAAKNLSLEALELKMNEAMLKEIPTLQAWETFLKIIASVAPLLGLLGTVTGMIVTFQSITVYGAGDPQVMSVGISAALVTTVLGLLVAIPTLLMLTLIASRSRRIIQILEQQATGIVAQHQELI